MWWFCDLKWMYLIRHCRTVYGMLYWTAIYREFTPLCQYHETSSWELKSFDILSGPFLTPACSDAAAWTRICGRGTGNYALMCLEIDCLINWYHGLLMRCSSECSIANGVPRSLDYQEIAMLVIKNFQTQLLIGWQRIRQPIRSHVGKYLLTNMDIHMDLHYNPSPRMWADRAHDYCKNCWQN